MRILIVEDDTEIAEVIALAFEMRWPDANIHRSATGEDAVDLVEADKPDLAKTYEFKNPLHKMVLMSVKVEFKP